MFVPNELVPTMCVYRRVGAFVLRSVVLISMQVLKTPVIVVFYLCSCSCMPASVIPLLSWQVADLLYVVRGFTAHVEAPCAVIQTGQIQIHNRPPAGLKPRAEARQQLEVPQRPAWSPSLCLV